jgi:branched-chain amino acid transport system permease protein
VHEFVQQLVLGIAWGSIYALIALGYTLVYGILRLINFAHGDVYMVGAFAGLYFARWGGVAAHPTFLGASVVVLASMVLCAVLGVVIERVAYRPLRKAPRLAMLITAIGVSLLLENLCQLRFWQDRFHILGPDPQAFPSLIEPKVYTFWGGGKGAVAATISNVQVIVLCVSVGLMIALWLIVMKTKMGKAMRAVSYDKDIASLMGVNIDTTISFTFALGSALAAAAGILTAIAKPKVEPLMGIMPGIKAFVAAVLGGIGNVPGAMLGGVIMGVAEYMVVWKLSSTWKDAIAFAILILILLIRPTGLLGSTAVEKV